MKFLLLIAFICYIQTDVCYGDGYINFSNASSPPSYIRLDILLETPIGSMVFKTADSSETLIETLSNTSSILLAPRSGSTWPGLQYVKIETPVNGTIQELILNGSAVNSDFYIPLNAVASVTAYLNNDTHIYFMADYDNQILVKHDCTNSKSFSLQHSFDSAGLYTLNVHGSNFNPAGSDSSINFHVATPINGITVAADSAVIDVGESFSLSIEISGDISNPVADLKVFLTCETTPELIPVNTTVSSTRSCTYITPGLYTPKLNFTDAFGNVLLSTPEVSVNEPCAINTGPYYYTVGDTASFCNPPYGFTYSINFGDGTFANGSDFQNETIVLPVYSIGTYNITRTASRFEDIYSSTIVVYEHPIPQSDMTNNVSTDGILITPPGMILFELKNPVTSSYPGPTDVTCDFTDADSSFNSQLNTSSVSVSDSKWFTFLYYFSRTGPTVVTLNCSNHISSTVLSNTFQVNAFSAEDVVVNHPYVVPMNNSDPNDFTISYTITDYNISHPGITKTVEFDDANNVTEMSVLSEVLSVTRREGFSLNIDLEYYGTTQEIRQKIRGGILAFTKSTAADKGQRGVTSFNFEISSYLYHLTHAVIINWDDGTPEETLTFTSTTTPDTTAPIPPRVESKSHIFDDAPRNVTPYLTVSTLLGFERLDLSAPIFIDNVITSVSFSSEEQYAYNQTSTATYNVLGNFYPLTNIRCTYEHHEGTTGPEIFTVTSFSNIWNINIPPDVQPGLKNISLFCENDVSSSTNATGYKLVCFESGHLFAELHRSADDAKKVRSDIEQLITGRVSKPCINASKLIYEWKIEKEDGTLLTMDQPNIYRINAQDYLKDAGKYQVSLKVSVPDVVPSVFIEDLLWVELIIPPPVAKIKGGTERETGHGNAVALDATEVSYDPNVGYGNPDPGLQFEWKCYVITDELTLKSYVNPTYIGTEHRSKPACSVILPQQGQITMDSTNLVLNTWALLEVSVKKETRVSTSLQSVKILPGTTPTVELKCKLNCQEKVVPYDITSIESTVTCTECTPDQMSKIQYQWTVYKYSKIESRDVELPWNPLFTSAQTHNVFDADRNVFDDGSNYLLKLKVTIEPRPPATANFRFDTDFKPYGGTCKVVPEEGKASFDDFYIDCSGWKDEGLRLERGDPLDESEPLFYQTTQIVKDTDVVVNDGADSVTPTFKLQLCPEETDFICNMTVQISDTMLYSTTVNFTVKVTSPIPPSVSSGDTPGTEGENSNEEVQIQAIDSLTGTVDKFLDEKTPTEKTMLVSTVASVINDVPIPESAVESIDITEVTDSNSQSELLVDSLKSEDPLEEKLTQALEDLMEKSTDVVNSAMQAGPVSLSQILQFSTTVGSSVSKPEIVSETAQEAITDSAVKLSEGLLFNTDKNLKEADIRQALAGLGALQDKIISIGSPDIPDESDEGFPEETVTNEKGFNPEEADYFKKFRNKKRMVRARRRFRKAKQNVEKNNKIWNNTFAIMERFTASETPRVLKLKTFTMKYQKVSLSMLAQQSSNESDYDDNGITIGRDGIELDPDTEVKIKTVVLKKNIYIQGSNSPRVTGPVVTSALTDAKTGSPITPKRQKTNFKNPKDISFSRVSPIFIEDDASGLFYMKTLYKTKGSHICILLRPERQALTYDVFWRSLIAPSDFEYDFVHTELELGSDSKTLIGCLEPSQVTRTGLMYAGLRPSKTAEADQPSRRKRRAATNTSNTDSDDLAAPFNISMQTFSCLTWSGVKQDWDDDKCELEHDLAKGVISCLCPGEANSITASSFFVAPNKIDFATVFSKFDIQSQAAVLSTIIIIILLGILAAMWGQWKDSIDVLQWGVTVLEDNFSEDQYYYLITVYTGFVREGSTMSNVSFDLYGEQNNTDVRKLSDGVRKGFQAGSVMHFLLAVPEHLGNLQYLRIWHDNSGKGKYASWNLNRIEVVDIQLNESFVFMTNSWLSIEESAIDKVIPVCGTENLKNFRSIFLEHARNHVTDEHVWLSVFFRPIKSHFTRVQRVGCCVALLFLSMISNAMFFQSDTDQDRQRTAAIELGPIKFNPGQIFISFISALITAVPVTIIMIMFRKSKLKPMVRKQRSIPNWLPKKIKARLEFSQKLEDILVIPDNVALKDAVLPHWCKYIGWLLVFASTVVSAFFLMLYSMEWGKDISEEWLTTFFLCFVESVTCVDPFKVLFLAVIAGMLFRTLRISKPTVYDMEEIKYFSAKHGQETTDRRQISIHLPVQDAVFQFTKARKLRDSELKNTIKEMIINILVLVILVFILYSNRDTKSYNIYQYISQNFLDPPKPFRKYEKVTQTKHYFEWLDQTVIESLFPENDYTGTRMTASQRLFSYDSSNLRVGPPRLRQVRAVSENFTYPFVGDSVKISAYELVNEDEEYYCPFWTNQPCSDSDELLLTIEAWKFTPSADIWGLPIAGLVDTYGGGGYIANLDVNKIVSTESLKELFDHHWIDRHTRAVFFEFTLFNVDINMFVYVSILTEFPATGGVVTYYNIFPFRPSQHVGNTGVFIIACEVGFVLYIIISLVMMVIKLSKQKLQYFKNFWNVVEVTSISVSLGGIILFIIRDQAVTEALALFKENDRAFVNFYHIVLWDYAFVYVLGVVVTIATLRLLKAMAYTSVTQRVFNVLSASMKVFPGFAAFIGINLVGFSIIGYILFSRTSKFYSSFLAAFETMFVGLLGDATFKYTNAEVNLNIVETIFFSLFVIGVTVLLTNLFMAILMDVMTRAQEAPLQKELEMNVFMYMWESISEIITGRPSDYSYQKKDVMYDPLQAQSDYDAPDPIKPSPSNFDHMIKYQDKLDKGNNLTIYHKLSSLNL